MHQALVTGSNGFIGSTLVEYLLKQDYKVRCLVRKTSNLKWLQGLSVEYYYGDLRVPNTLPSAVGDVDIVFHLAGITRAKNHKEFMEGNYKTTVNLLNACNALSQKPKFVFISSQAAGGPSQNSVPKSEDDDAKPISQYGISKLAAEQAVLKHAQEFPVTIIRPPSVYGPKDRDVFLLFKNIHFGLKPMIKGGRQKISMVYINDLVDGIILAAEHEKAEGEIFNISGDELLEWKNITNIMTKAMDRKAVQVGIPLWCLDIASYLSMALSKISKKSTLLNRDKIHEMKQDSWLLSNEKAKALLGFQPKYDLLTGFRQTIKWYKKNDWL
jgi:dihydroflavonol-4-reductase